MPDIPSPKVSTGTIATTSNPTTPVFQSFADAKKVAPVVDTGTNAPTVTLAQSQLAGPQSFDAAFKKANPGQISPNSDLRPYTPLADRNGQNEFIAKNTPAPKAPTTAAVAKAPPADAGPAVQPAQPAAQPGRNKYFNNDYYIDDLEIESAFMASRGPSSFSTLSFKVTEPNGISLAYNLSRAVQDLYKSTSVNPVNAIFVMVVRFYGWDEKGNLVTKITPAAGTPGAVPNNSNAAVVKYLPFTIKELDFKMNGKVVEYHIKGASANYNVAQGTALGTVPHDWQLVGETVEQVLNGTATAKVVSGDDSKRKTTPNNNDIKVREMSIKEQAAIVAGTDPNAVNDQGMAFGGGGL